MKEKTKLLVVGGVIVALLLVLILIGVINKNTKKEENTPTNDTQTVVFNGKYSTDYEKAFEGEGKKVLFLGSSTCGVCSVFTPYMQYLSEAYNFSYYYIDAATINTNDLQKVLEKLGKNIDSIGTPYMAFIENGIKYDELQGYQSESALFELLQKNGIISKEETYISSTEAASTMSNDERQYTHITFIGYNAYQEVYDSGEKSIVILGKAGCGNCNSFKPVINEIAGEKNLKVYYVDLTELSDENAYQIMSSLTYLKDKASFVTPLTMVLENKEVKDAKEGYLDKESTLKFLQDNGMIQ